MDDADVTFKPPYMSFHTFWHFIEELGAKPLPPQIDRSLLSSRSGTDQNLLTYALTAFGLTGPGGTVLPTLRELVDAPEVERPNMLANLIRRFYDAPLRVAQQNGTEQQLHEAFRDAYGLTALETRRKAVTFFLHAARKANIPLSPHFPNTRGGSGAPGVPRKIKKVIKRAAPAASGTPASGQQQSVSSDGYSLTVKLSTGDTMTLTVDVNPLTLKGADRTFFYAIVDKMDGYGTEHPAPSPAADEGHSEGGEGDS